MELTTYTVIFRRSFSKEIARIQATDEKHLDKKLAFRCIDKSKVISIQIIK